MKKTSSLNALLATAACSLLTMSCAKDLPELPVISYPAIQTLPELPPISALYDQENLPELPLPASPTENHMVTTTMTTLATPTASSVYEAVDLSSIESPPTIRHENPALKIIADDLVAALSFVNGMSPGLITVKAPANTSQFDELVKNAFAKKGYEINNTRALNVGQQLTTSFVINENQTSGREITGIISINGILVKRSYSVDNRSIEANTSYMIKGANPRQIRYTDQIQVI